MAPPPGTVAVPASPTARPAAARPRRPPARGWRRDRWPTSAVRGLVRQRTASRGSIGWRRRDEHQGYRRHLDAPVEPGQGQARQAPAVTLPDHVQAQQQRMDQQRDERGDRQPAMPRRRIVPPSRPGWRVIRMGGHLGSVAALHRADCPRAAVGTRPPSPVRQSCGGGVAGRNRMGTRTHAMGDVARPGAQALNGGATAVRHPPRAGREAPARPSPARAPRRRRFRRHRA